MSTMRGKTALITGASRGIGAEIAKEFAREGANVVITARSSSDNPGKLPGTIEDMTTELRSLGADALGIVADLSKEEDRERIHREATDRFGSIDILVNNAAVTYFQPLTSLKLSRVSLMYDIQVVAPLHLSQLVLPDMRERRQGWILNITSMESRPPRIPPGKFNAMGTTTGYGMTKAALERMTNGLAAELFSDGVSVMSLYPGKLVPTPGILFHGIIKEDDPKAEDPRVMAQAALQLCTSTHEDYTGGVYESTTVLDGTASPPATQATGQGTITAKN